VSYGRRPYYIYQGEYDNGETYFCFMDQIAGEDGIGANIEYDAMAQFVATMWSRENMDLTLLHGELKDLVERGLELRPELKKDVQATHR
jgi:hypothetical protein